MKTVLHSEICKERPNKAVLGAFNKVVSGLRSNDLGIMKSQIDKASPEMISDAQKYWEERSDKLAANAKDANNIKRSGTYQALANKADLKAKTLTDASRAASKPKYGVQPNGQFHASNMKQFGGKVDAMASQKNPGSVLLKNRDGSTRIKVEKHGTLYTVTTRYSEKDTRRSKYSAKEFEKNYRHFLG